MQSQKLIIGYWNIRGLGQHIRHIAEITESQYEEKRYKDPNEWFAKDKLNLGLDFPNLPYLIDGDIKLTQSQAIVKYLINKSGKTELLGGQDPKKNAEIEMLQSLVLEIQKELNTFIYNPEFSKIKESIYTEKFGPQLLSLSTYLGQKKFLTGTQYTLPDIWLYEFLTVFQQIYPQDFSKMKNLENLIINIENIPQMKNYLSSDRYLKSPYNFDQFGAQWNN